MYRSIRWIHGQLALALALAVFVYAISGWLIPNGRFLFPEVPSVIETRRVDGLAQAGEAAGSLDREAALRLAMILRDELDLPGRLVDVRGDATGGTARLSSASTRTALRWTAGSDEVQLTIRPSSIGHSLAALHRVHGARGGPEYFLFSVVVDGVGVAMIVFGVTGVILWWQIKPKKGLGIGILGASSALTLGWIALLTWGP